MRQLNTMQDWMRLLRGMLMVKVVYDWPVKYVRVVVRIQRTSVSIQHSGRFVVAPTEQP